MARHRVIGLVAQLHLKRRLFLAAAALFYIDLPFLRAWMEPFLLPTGAVLPGLR